jgi:hypothetical protein
MENIDITELVADIKACEKANRTGWRLWCEKNEIGKRLSEQYWSAPDYAEFVTGLYTLRAYLRGRMHRKNPPAHLRDYHRSMVDAGIPHELKWDMEGHNQRIAEATAQRYLLEDKEHSVQQKEIRPPETKGRTSLLSRLFGG